MIEAGGGAGSGIYELGGSYIANKPPHRHLAAPTPWGGRIRRGLIQAHDELFNREGQRPNGAFAFHFNPERINITYTRQMIDQLTEGALAATGAPGGQIEGAYNIGFVVLLNRQYDVLEQGNRGTLHDVDVLLGLLGYGDYIEYRPVRVIFSTMFSFYGTVTSLNVTHHQFTADMVPVWTTLDISMTNVPEPLLTMESGLANAHTSPQDAFAGPGSSYGLDPLTGVPKGL